MDFIFNSASIAGQRDDAGRDIHRGDTLYWQRPCPLGRARTKIRSVARRLARSLHRVHGGRTFDAELCYPHIQRNVQQSLRLHVHRRRELTLEDNQTFTAEHRSWQWELVLQYEDGSLAASAWNEPTLNIIATWYAKNLAADQARTRYEQHFHRNRRRLSHRLEGAVAATGAIEAVDAVWESLLTRALDSAG